MLIFLQKYRDNKGMYHNNPTPNRFQNKKVVKTIPAYKPISAIGSSPDNSPEKKINPEGSGGPIPGPAVVFGSPESPSSSSNDAINRKSKKGRRPNSAASRYVFT